MLNTSWRSAISDHADALSKYRDRVLASCVCFASASHIAVIARAIDWLSAMIRCLFAAPKIILWRDTSYATESWDSIVPFRISRLAFFYRLALSGANVVHTRPGRSLRSFFIDPSQPTVRDKLPAGPDWVYEVKHDGYRLQVHRCCRLDHPTQ